MSESPNAPITEAEIRDNPSRISEYLANNFRSFVQPEQHGGKMNGIWVWQRKFDEIGSGDAATRDKYALGLLLLIYMYGAKITDLHVEVQWGWVCHVKWRKDQLLLPITVTALFSAYDYIKNTSKVTLPFSDKILRYIRDVLGKDELVFDLSNPYEVPVYEFIMEAMMTFCQQPYTWSVFYKNLSKNTTLHFVGTKLPYRTEFVPQMLEGQRYYTFVTRLLVIKLIKPKYGVYSSLVETLASGKWIFLVCGKTNSGKSTTVFSLFDSEHQKNPNRAFYAVEDPVEKALDFVTHFETFINPQNPEEKMGFSEYLTSIVRLDGDYAFLGEMRDGATINNAVQLSTIGYSIFSTIHIGSAFKLKSRVEKYGVDFGSLSESLKGIIVQELLPNYDDSSCKYIKDFTEAEIKNQLPIIREIWGFGQKGGAARHGSVLHRFYDKVLKFKPLIENNSLYPNVADDPEFKNEYAWYLAFKEAVGSYEKFVTFLYTSFKTDTGEKIPKTKGMELVFEVLPVDDNNRDAYTDGDRKGVYEVENAFLPHFINGMITLQHSGVALKDLLRLSGNY